MATTTIDKRCRNPEREDAEHTGEREVSTGGLRTGLGGCEGGGLEIKSECLLKQSE